MKTVKRVLSIFMCATLMLTSVPLSGFVGLDLPSLFDFKAQAAYTGECGDNLTWSLDTISGALTISGEGEMYDYTYGSSAPWYSYRSYIETVNIAVGVTTIGDYAFNNCDSLTSVTIPDGVTSIGKYVFRYCYNLTSVTIPDGVITIGEHTFYDCDSLISITIPDSVTTVGESVFYLCDNLTSVIIGNSVTTIGRSVFYWCESLTSVMIGNSVTSIGYQAFYACRSLKSITIPDSVTAIDDYAFELCDNLTSITIPDSITSIGDDAFGDCDSLTSITVDENNNYYSNDEYGVLFNKDKTVLVQYPIGNTRTSYTIPDSVTVIGDDAFEACHNLTSVTIPDSVTTIGNNAFRSCYYLTSITIPHSVTAIGDSAFGYCYLTRITVDENNNYYSNDEYGVLFNKDKTKLLQYPIGNTRTSYAIPDSVTSIGDDAFINCESLTSITITDDVTSIGEYAFYDCESLTSITIPDGVTSIGRYAFAHTGIEDNSDNWINGVFYIGNHLIKAESTLYGSYTIMDATITIADDAFNSCKSLKKITIPDSVTAIGKATFSFCDSLTDVYYNGTQSQWVEISIASGNDPLTSATIHFLNEEESTTEEYTTEEDITEESTTAPEIETTTKPPVTEQPSIEDESDLDHTTTTRVPETTTQVAPTDPDGFITILAGEAKTVSVTGGNITYIRFVPTKTALYTFSSSGDSDTYGYLFNSDMEQLAYNDDGGNNTNFSITRRLNAGETYYIGVKFYDTGASGLITVNLTKLNDYTMSVGETKTVSVTGGNITYIRFVPTETAFYTFCSTGDSDTYGYFYNSYMEQLAYNDDGGNNNNFSITRSLNAGETYYFGVKFYDYNASGSITVNLTKSNDYTMLAGETKTVSVTGGNITYIRFVPTETALYTFCSIDDSDTYGYLYNSYMERLAYNDNSGNGSNFEITHRLNAGETYYFGVEFYDSNASGSITVNLTKSDPDSLITISAGETRGVAVTSGSFSYIRFVPTETAFYTLYSNGDKDTYCYLYDSYMEQLVYGDNGGSGNNFKITRRLNAGETYYISISLYNQDFSDTLAVTLRKLDSEGFITMSAGETKGVAVTGGSLSYIRFVPTETAIYTFSSSGDSDTEGYLYDSDMNQLVYNDDGGNGSNFEITHSLNAGETYYIGVRFYNYETSGMLTVTVTKVDPTSACGNNLTWSFNESTGVLAISGTGAMYDYLSWDSSSDSYYFTPRPWDEYFKSITSVEVGSGVTYIGSGAFTELVNIKTVNLPETVVEIGKWAFAACISLTGFTVDEDNPIFMADEDGVLYGKEDMNALPEEYRNEDYEYALVLFNYPIGNGVREYTVAENVYAVGDFAFACCPTLEKITFPQTYMSLGEAVLSSCPALRTVTLNPLKLMNIGDSNYDWLEQCPELIYSIEADCGENVKSKLAIDVKGSPDSATLTISGTGEMYDYHSYDDQPWAEFREIITEVIIEDGVTGVGNYAFVYCYELTSVTIGNSVTTIGEGAFGVCYSLQSITIPDSVVAIEMIAFRGCGSLESITLGKGLKTIGMYAFSDCDSLQSITIPDSVTTVDMAAFEDCYNLESVTISNNVTEISGRLFYNCDNLTSITIPDSVKTIGTGAFYSCNGLENVTFGNNSQLTEIGYQSFYDCNDLKNIKIPDNVIIIRMSAFENCYNLASVTFGENSQLTEIEDCVFRECSDLISVEIPDSVTRIGENVFGADFSKLKTVTFGENSKLTTIGDEAFSYCESLEGITIPASVTEIGEGAFIGCQSLTAINVDEANEEYCSVDGVLYSKDKTVLVQYPAGKADKEFTIPDTVKEIGAYAFAYCYNLETLTIPDSVTTIGSYAFYGSEFAIVSSFGGLTEIGDYAFAYCDFTTFDIPEGIETIGNYAFYECYNLQSVTIPDSVTVIGSYAFACCYNLQSVTVPDSVAAVGKAAFKYCSSLTKVEIGSGLKRIPQNMFEDCYNLTEVEISEGVTDIGDYAFYGCDALKTVNIPASVATVGTEAFDSCESLEGFEVSADNVNFCSENGVLFNKDKTVLICYPAGKTARSYTVPSTVTEILPYAFSGAANLRQITIPATVTTIGGYAFSYSGLISVELENGITVIGEDAFSNCVKLQSVSIPATVTKIETDAFYRCYDLTDVYYYSTSENWNKIEIEHNYYLDYATIHYVNIQAEDYEFINGELIVTGGSTVATRFSKLNFAQDILKITVKDDVEQIMEFAFADLPNVTEVNIAKSVSSIGNFAFENCPKLKTVNLDVAFEERSDEEETTEEPVCEISEENSDWDIAYNGEIVPNAEAEDNVTTTTRAATTTTRPPTTTTVAPTTTTQEDTEEYTTMIRPERPTTTRPYYEEPEEDEYSSYRTIGIMAFAGCESLENIVIPENFKTIGNYAFADCTKLNSVTLNDGLKNIGSAAFNNCTSLSEITIPVSTKEMGYDAFYGCSSLETVYFNAVNCDITSASDYEKLVFGERDSLKNFYFGDKVHTIPYEILRGNSSITEIVIPDNVTYISSYAFYNCSALTKAVIGSGVEDMGYGVFRDCDTLSDVTIREGVTVIGDNAFEHCDSLTNITIPDSVTDIYSCALVNCYNLKNITIGKGLEYLHSYAFYDCYSLVSISVDDENACFANSSDGVLFSKDGTKLVYYPIGKPNMTYSIPEGVTIVGDRSFRNSQNLVSIGIPTSVEMIGDYAFLMGDNLTDAYYAGTEEQWNEISKSDWFLPDSTTLHFNSTVPDTAVASGTCGDNLTWTLDANGKLVISGTGEMDDYGTEENCAPWTMLNVSVSSVEIESGVTSVGESAFACCHNMTDVTLPEGLERIGSSAFFETTKLTEITIPESVNSIGDAAFAWSGLESVDIPKGVKSIGAGAFWECYDLTNIYFAENSELTTIGARAFANCGLLNITIPENVEQMGIAVLAWCDNLEFIDVDVNNKYFSSSTDGVLYNKTKTELIQFPIGSGIIGYNVESTVTDISAYAFENCNKLESIILWDNLKNINAAAFYGCKNLKNVYFVGTEEQWKNISIEAYNESLTSATIHFNGENPAIVVKSGTCGDNLTWVLYDDGELVISGTGDMYNYTYLGQTPWAEYNDRIVEITVGEGVTSVGIGAFYGCSAVKSICLTSTVVNLRLFAFGACTALEEINISSDNALFCSEDGVVYSKDKSTLVRYPAGKTSTGFEVPESVQVIGNEAFSESVYLETVSIPESVKKIDYHAFYGSQALTTVEIPASIEIIGNNVFDACYSLEAIKVSADNAIYSSADGVLFNKARTELIYYPAAKETTYTIPDGVKTIKENAFLFSNVDTFVIPTSVTVIEAAQCRYGSANKTVYYAGTKAEWNKISIDSSEGLNDTLINANVHFGAAGVTYTVTYHINGGSGTVPEQQIKVHGESLVLDSTRPNGAIRITYIGDNDQSFEQGLRRMFVEWNTEPDGNGKAYRPGAEYTADTNLELFAIWEDEVIGEFPFTPVKEGYMFVGWFTSPTGGVQVTPSTKWTEDIILYAHWAKQTYETSNCKISIKRPKVNEVNYGDVLIFEAVTNDLPEGAKIVWSVSGDISGKPIVSKDGMSYEVYAKGKGEIKVTATVVNGEGVPYQNVNGNIIKVQKSFTIKAGFREIFIWILKSLFGLTTVYTPETFL